MTLTQLIALGGVILLATMSPGPDFVIVTRNAVQSGRRAGMACAAGIASGLFAWAVVAALGVAGLLAASAVAFPLYLIHAVLTGLSLAIAYLLDIHLGFSFSAGLIDLLLYGTAPAAKNIPLLIVMGVVFVRRRMGGSAHSPPHARRRQSSRASADAAACRSRPFGTRTPCPR